MPVLINVMKKNQQLLVVALHLASTDTLELWHKLVLEQSKTILMAFMKVSWLKTTAHFSVS